MLKKYRYLFAFLVLVLGGSLAYASLGAPIGTESHTYDSHSSMGWDMAIVLLSGQFGDVSGSRSNSDKKIGLTQAECHGLNHVDQVQVTLCPNDSSLVKIYTFIHDLTEFTWKTDKDPAHCNKHTEHTVVNFQSACGLGKAPGTTDEDSFSDH